MSADAATIGIGRRHRPGRGLGAAVRWIAVMLFSAGLILSCRGADEPGGTNMTDGSSSAFPATGGGWQTIFDGTSTEALRSYGGGAFAASWAVEDGALRTVPGKPVDLITDESYGDFELEFGWRVSRAGNS